MTEAEWMTATDPTPMLDHLRGPAVIEMRSILGRQMPLESYSQPLGSKRKWRLLAVACCRRHWHLMDEAHCWKLAEVGEQMSGRTSPSGLPLESCQRGLELAEMAADETVDADALRVAQEAADLYHHAASDYAACYDDGWGPYDTELMASGSAAHAVYLACNSDADFVSVSATLRRLTDAVEYLQSDASEQTRQSSIAAERVAQAALLRDIFGNPFRPIAFDPAWRTEPTVGMAAKMYEDREFAAMPILADALEEAGCDNADILNHCREPGVHVRGCWVVDLLLGKE